DGGSGVARTACIRNSSGSASAAGTTITRTTRADVREAAWRSARRATDNSSWRTTSPSSSAASSGHAAAMACCQSGMPVYPWTGNGKSSHGRRARGVDSWNSHRGACCASVALRSRREHRMRSAIHARFGDPAEVLAPGDRPVPEPGKGEVRVRMRLAPIHNHDLFTIRGQYGWKPSLPAIGGSEGCGVVDAIGEDVEGFAPGQRVTTASARGTWAEYFLADARALVPVPDAMPDEVAAQLVAMPLSALMLLESLAVEPGQWIVQNAANGAVGKTLAMLAAARGVRVLGLVRREEGVAELAALGVEDVLCTQADGWRDAARERLGADGARAAVDSVGGPMVVPPGDVIFRDVQVRGFWGSRASREMPAVRKRALFAELIQRALDGQLRLPVDAIYDLEQVAEAAAASQRTGRGGKVL